jgi:hypothetical protein
MDAQEILSAIEEHGLLLRPSVTGNWRCGVFRGITGDGKAYCAVGSECEKATIEGVVAEAVRWASTHSVRAA